MKSRTVEVNGVEICAFSNGEIERFNRKSREFVRNVGTMTTLGYRKIYLGGKVFLVHRIIASALIGKIEAGMEVDHVNGDRSDNRLENLRITTHQQNNRSFNKPSVGTSSKHRGVSWLKQSKKWRAAICVNGKTKHLGSFSAEEDAAKCYNKAALDLGYSAEALNKV